VSTDLDRIPGTPGPAASQATVVEQTRAAAEVIAAVRAAQAVPRDRSLCVQRMRAACSQYELAAQAFYAYRMGGSEVAGPTVALARELAAIWGNLDAGTVELDRDDGRHRSEVRAHAWDQETNTRITRSVIVPHVNYVGRTKQRALTEMREIDANNNSVGGRALREVIYAVLPKAFVEEAKRICHETVQRGPLAPDGSEVDLSVRIGEAVAAFGRARPPVTQATLEGKIGRPAAKWTAEDVAQLDILFNTLKRGEISREEAFPDEQGGISGDDLRAQAAAAPPGGGEADPWRPPAEDAEPEGEAR
jgi:hypothetical protein